MGIPFLFEFMWIKNLRDWLIFSHFKFIVRRKSEHFSLGMLNTSGFSQISQEPQMHTMLPAIGEIHIFPRGIILGIILCWTVATKINQHSSNKRITPIPGWILHSASVDCRSGAPSWDQEKSISQTHAQKIVVWQELFGWKASPVSYLCPVCCGKKPKHVFRKAKTSVIVQSHCAILKLNSVQTFSLSG